ARNLRSMGAHMNRNRITQVLGLLLVVAATGGAARGEPIQGELRIREGSSLAVEGRSNVNEFRYEYRGMPQGAPHGNLGPARSVVELLHNETLDLDIAQFDSGNRRMNRDLRKLLNAEQHPDIRIGIVDITAFN